MAEVFGVAVPGSDACGVGAGDVTGLVLAGGLGRRMAPEAGGVDKGLLPLDGTPLAAHVLERLRPQVTELRISANDNIERYRALGAPAIRDALPGRPGPLAGIHAGLIDCTTTWLAVVPCDAPFVPADLVGRLYAAVTRDGARVAAARCEGRTHWTHLLVNRSLRASLESFIEEGGRRVQEWCAAQGCAFADFPDASAFANLNTRADLGLHASR